MQSAVTGQAPITLERKTISGEKQLKQKILCARMLCVTTPAQTVPYNTGVSTAVTVRTAQRLEIHTGTLAAPSPPKRNKNTGTTYRCPGFLVFTLQILTSIKFLPYSVRTWYSISSSARSAFGYLAPPTAVDGNIKTAQAYIGILNGSCISVHRSGSAVHR